jgi:hypothetical protein
LAGAPAWRAVLKGVTIVNLSHHGSIFNRPILGTAKAGYDEDLGLRAEQEVLGKIVM